MVETGEIEAAAAGAAGRYMEALAQAIPDIESRIAAFIERACLVGPLEHYKHFPAELHELAAEIERTHGLETRRSFLRAVLTRTVQGTVAGAPYRNLPPLTASNQARHLLRIAQDSNTEADWLSMDQDLFQKEFGLASLRLYAAGSQLVDPRCGVPRSTVIQEGMRSAPSKFLAIGRLGGFKPYFQIHTHSFNLDAFHEQGWEECYRCCAELYDVHPEVLGMYGSSWFYDPALDIVSPRLAYLRTTPCSNGALLMFVARGGEAIANATATSASRRALMDAGTYMPTNYMLIWGRDAQRAWAKQSGGRQAG
jgi:hypothetical protein